MRRRASSRVGSIALLKLKSGKEIDFIEGDEAFGIAYELIQVSLSMKNEATRQREVCRAARSHGALRKERRNHNNARRRIKHQRPRRSYPRNTSLEVVVGVEQSDRRRLIRRRLQKHIEIELQLLEPARGTYRARMPINLSDPCCDRQLISHSSILDSQTKQTNIHQGM